MGQHHRPPHKQARLPQLHCSRYSQSVRGISRRGGLASPADILSVS